MTNREAIKVLQMVEAHGLAAEAKRMAIEALTMQEKRRGRGLGPEPTTICAEGQEITLESHLKPPFTTAAEKTERGVEAEKGITIERIDRQIALLKALKANLDEGKKIIDQLERF